MDPSPFDRSSPRERERRARADGDRDHEAIERSRSARHWATSRVTPPLPASIRRSRGRSNDAEIEGKRVAARIGKMSVSVTGKLDGPEFVATVTPGDASRDSCTANKILRALGEHIERQVTEDERHFRIDGKRALGSGSRSRRKCSSRYTEAACAALYGRLRPR